MSTDSEKVVKAPAGGAVVSPAQLAEVRASILLPPVKLCPGCGRGFRSHLAAEALSEHMKSCGGMERAWRMITWGWR